MHLKQFGPFTVYWKEADILGPARLTFNASSFFVDGMDGNYYPNLHQVADQFDAAWLFLSSKRIELCLTAEKNEVK
jgi:hypothetical protein